MSDTSTVSEQEYLTSRVQDQIDWHDKKSQHCQKWFKRTRRIELTSAILIPFIAGLGLEHLSFYVGALGVIIAVSAGLSTLSKWQENWILYRTTSESLLHEKNLFQTRTGLYSGDKPFNLFVQRIENLLSQQIPYPI